MTIQYNAITREGWANVLLAAYLSGSVTLRIYNSSVAYPNAPQALSGTLATGTVIGGTSVTLQRVGSTLSFTAGTNTSVVTVGAGPITWWALMVSGSTPVISDSVGLSGSGSILTVSNMNPGSGTTLTFSLNLSVV